MTFAAVGRKKMRIPEAQTLQKCRKCEEMALFVCYSKGMAQRPKVALGRLASPHSHCQPSQAAVGDFLGETCKLMVHLF